VPAIALAGHWQVAAGLILLQGLGRGTRKPIVQAMLRSHVALVAFAAGAQIASLPVFVLARRHA